MFNLFYPKRGISIELLIKTLITRNGYQFSSQELEMLIDQLPTDRYMNSPDKDLIWKLQDEFRRACKRYSTDISRDELDELKSRPWMSLLDFNFTSLLREQIETKLETIESKLLSTSADHFDLQNEAFFPSKAETTSVVYYEPDLINRNLPSSPLFQLKTIHPFDYYSDDWLIASCKTSVNTKINYPFYNKAEQVINQLNLSSSNVFKTRYLFYWIGNLARKYSITDPLEVINKTITNHSLYEMLFDGFYFPCFDIKDEKYKGNLNITSRLLETIIPSLYPHSSSFYYDETQMKKKLSEAIDDNENTTFITFELLPPWFYMKVDEFKRVVTHYASLYEQKNRLDIKHSFAFKFFIQHLLSILDFKPADLKEEDIIKLTPYTNFIWWLLLILFLTPFTKEKFIFYNNQFIFYGERFGFTELEKIINMFQIHNLKPFNLMLYDKVFDPYLIFQNEVYLFKPDRKELLNHFLTETEWDDNDIHATSLMIKEEEDQTIIHLKDNQELTHAYFTID